MIKDFIVTRLNGEVTRHEASTDNLGGLMLAIQAGTVRCIQYVSDKGSLSLPVHIPVTGYNF